MKLSLSERIKKVRRDLADVRTQLDELIAKAGGEGRGTARRRTAGEKRRR